MGQSIPLGQADFICRKEVKKGQVLENTGKRPGLVIMVG
ncbi:hypothetical protein D1AOALGA4SA_11312 [Olavius algarvensis Delta 1 endosymbiont]|nr:hypothetical protein D1AOALGA4SA_11312 [Olavius algarvensis Delta 1 endosymbiont]